MIKFPYGKILPPLHGQLGTFGAPGQNTICIPKDMLNKITRRSKNVPRLEWEHGGRFSFHNDDAVVKVLRWDWDWWRVRVFDGFDEFHDLCLAFSDRVVLFPSRESAVLAAEVLASTQPPDLASLVWIDRQGSWRSRGGTGGLDERPQAEPSQGITAP
jgi:hypothetical protein